MKDRFKAFGLIMSFILIGIPLLMVIFILMILSLFLIPIDLPIWLLTGKHPFADLIGKLNSILRI